MPPRRFVFLDRDGTIQADKHFLAHPAGVELLPHAAEALARLQRLGLGLVVVSNQSGVARGLFTIEDVDRVNDRLVELLMRECVRLDAIYYCAHGPDDGCQCRKPLPGMIHRAAEQFDFDPAQAFVIGDRKTDVDLGRAVGATTFLVRTGYGASAALDRELQADYVVDDLDQAAAIIERLTIADPASSETGLG